MRLRNEIKEKIWRWLIRFFCGGFQLEFHFTLVRKSLAINEFFERIYVENILNLNFFCSEIWLKK